MKPLCEHKQVEKIVTLDASAMEITQSHTF